MTEWVLVPREPTAKMVLAAFDAITNASGEGMIRARWRCMLDAAPAAPQQAEPVAWMKPTRDSCYLRSAETMLAIHEDCDGIVRTGWKPLYLHPPAAEVQLLRDAVAKLSTIVRVPNAEHIADEHNAAVAFLRRALEGGE